MTDLLAPFLQRFFRHYLPLQKGLSANTIAAYRDAIKLLLRYAADTCHKSVDELRIADIDETLVLAFLDHLETARGCTPQTRNARLAAVRALFGFIAREEPAWVLACHKIRTIPRKRTEHRQIHYLEEDEMQALLDTVDLASRTGVRDQALLLLLYLNLTDLRLEASAHVTLLGKGQKHRSCLLWPETVQALQAYLTQRAPKNPTAEALFLNANGVPITRFGVRHIIGKYAAGAQIPCPSLASKTVTPHIIRHTAAMHLLRAGNELNMVSYWLGHANVNTTHAYVMAMKRRMLEKAGAPAVQQPLPWQKPDILQWLAALTKRST
jgi:site-specific recombinase XerD